MWLYRRLLRITWKDKRTNESVLAEQSVQRKLLKEMKKRKMKYVGHANRNTKTDLMTTVLQGKMDAKRKPGRPPTSYISNITSATGLKLHEAVWESKDRRKWLSVVASSGAPTNDPGDGDR